MAAPPTDPDGGGPGSSAAAAGTRVGWAQDDSDDPSDLLVTVNAEDGFDVSPELHRITAPTLVVADERDRYDRPGAVSRDRRAPPNARRRLYRGEGHASMFTDKPAVRDVVELLTAGGPSAFRTLR
jgi:pimeloyl-ACP methyl ester carboxylesterase